MSRPKIERAAQWRRTRGVPSRLGSSGGSDGAQVDSEYTVAVFLSDQSIGLLFALPEKERQLCDGPKTRPFFLLAPPGLRLANFNFKFDGSRGRQRRLVQK